MQGALIRNRLQLLKSCFELQPNIQNFFHPCSIVLNISRTMAATVMVVSIWTMASASYKCNSQMHVDCALKPPRESEDAEDDLTILHFTHQHPLKPVDLNLVDRVGCTICENLCFGSVYGCQICNVFLHNPCMETIPRKVNRFFHSCPLILFTYPHKRKMNVASDREVSRCLSGSSFHP
ncbi:hypothetical protein V6N13_036434 [Hibiscus sabdariffa]|uniref:Phorbol-ester/DAG-type domain-containing protein n=1 Tax=Hibiscus sabdariffa TaxID=183260 RepID=A0ABR2S6L9_9ROSI